MVENVIPAETVRRAHGTWYARGSDPKRESTWIPAFAGMTTKQPLFNGAESTFSTIPLKMKSIGFHLDKIITFETF